MKPHDVVRVSYPNGATFFWTVAAVLLGGERSEGVVELTPLNQDPNPHGRTLCPSALLDALCEGGTIAIMEHRKEQ